MGMLPSEFFVDDNLLICCVENFWRCNIIVPSFWNSLFKLEFEILLRFSKVTFAIKILEVQTFQDAGLPLNVF